MRGGKRFFVGRRIVFEPDANEEEERFLDDGEFARANHFAFLDAVETHLDGVGDGCVLLIEIDAPHGVGGRARHRQAAEPRIDIERAGQIVLQIDRELLSWARAHDVAPEVRSSSPPPASRGRRSKPTRSLGGGGSGGEGGAGELVSDAGGEAESGRSIRARRSA